jgi:tRNA pseudouridine(38-40) synthase
LEPSSSLTPVLSVKEDIAQHWDEYKEYTTFQQHPDGPNPFEEGPMNHQRIKFLAIAQQLLEQEASFSQYTPDAQDLAFGGNIMESEWPVYLRTALTRFRACLSLFVGTHNFHNYTINKTALDASAQRHLLSIRASNPVRIHDEMYIRVMLEGQSFMMHQIRKMMGIAIETARGRCNLRTVHCSLSRGKMITPLAPSTGLFLDKVE